LCGKVDATVNAVAPPKRRGSRDIATKAPELKWTTEMRR
jgi:hypothetical protein